MNKKITLITTDGEDMPAEITKFAEIFGLEQAASGRYSILLLLGLFGGFKSERLNPTQVIREIEALEGIGEPSRLKAPIQNRHPPLKGLWHKHFSDGSRREMAINFSIGLKKYGLPWVDQRIHEAQQAGEDRYFSIEDVPAIVNDAVHGNWKRRADEQELTGQWILYGQHEGKNYYLCLATHDKRYHADLRRQIDDVCCKEFPFLSALLANA